MKTRSFSRYSIYVALIVFLIALPGEFSRSASDLNKVSNGLWAVTQIGNELQIAYGSGINFPQYGALHLDSSYFRLNYGPTSGWGTSVILLPAFWSGGNYYQGAPVTATWQFEDPNLVFSITGTISTMNVYSQINLSPPLESSITAHITTTVTGNVQLDIRPGESFKPVMLSSMHISSTVWDTRMAFAGCQTFSIPESGWIFPPQPPRLARIFGLLGGTSDWKTNAPSIWIVLDQPMQVAGWVTSSMNHDDDNVGFWASSNEVLSSWNFQIIATSGLDINCLFMPIILRG